MPRQSKRVAAGAAKADVNLKQQKRSASASASASGGASSDTSSGSGSGSTFGFRRASVADIASGTLWAPRDRSYCLDEGESDLWRQILAERGWKDAGQLCDSREELVEIVAGERKPPAGARRRCLYLSLQPREHNVLCRLPQDDQRWRLCLFPGIEAACKKNATAAQFARMRPPPSHWPESYVLPCDKDALRAVAAQAKEDGADRSIWIAKPTTAWGGAGIVVFDAASPEFDTFVSSERCALDVSRDGRSDDDTTSAYGTQHPDIGAALKRQSGTVVQRYVHRPMLVGDYKFHIRVYVLVTQLRPTPVAFLHTGGLVEFTTKAFSLDQSTLGREFDPVVHLTNIAVQMSKENMGAVLEDKPGVGKGVVWTIDKFEQYLRSTADAAHAAHAAPRGTKRGKAGGDSDAATDAADRRVARFWDQVCAASREVVSGVASHASMKKFPNVPGRHFQHLGLDLVMDADEHVWLCECNDT
jgi:hypothetical protein